MFRQTHVQIVDGKRCIVANSRYIEPATVEQLIGVKSFTAKVNARTKEIRKGMKKS